MDEYIKSNTLIKNKNSISFEHHIKQTLLKKHTLNGFYRAKSKTKNQVNFTKNNISSCEFEDISSKKMKIKFKDEKENQTLIEIINIESYKQFNIIEDQATCGDKCKCIIY